MLETFFWILSIICNGNRIEWSPIRYVIMQVISELCCFPPQRSPVFSTSHVCIYNIYNIMKIIFHERYPFSDLQGDGITSLVFPLRPYIKSVHLIKFPSPKRHDFDEISISSADNTWSHTLKFVIIPLKNWPGSNTPGGSCSIPSTKDPPDLITWPVFKPPPCFFTRPSL